MDELKELQLRQLFELEGKGNFIEQLQRNIPTQFFPLDSTNMTYYEYMWHGISSFLESFRNSRVEGNHLNINIENKNISQQLQGAQILQNQSERTGTGFEKFTHQVPMPSGTSYVNNNLNLNNNYISPENPHHFQIQGQQPQPYLPPLYIQTEFSEAEFPGATAQPIENSYALSSIQIPDPRYNYNYKREVEADEDEDEDVEMSQIHSQDQENQESNTMEMGKGKQNEKTIKEVQKLIDENKSFLQYLNSETLNTYGNFILKQIGVVQEALQNFSNNTECLICVKPGQLRSIIFHPCKHQLACSDCSAVIKNCPVCNVYVLYQENELARNRDA